MYSGVVGERRALSRQSGRQTDRLTILLTDGVSELVTRTHARFTCQ